MYMYILYCSRDEQLSQLQSDLKMAPRKERVSELETELKESKDEGKKVIEELRKLA